MGWQVIGTKSVQRPNYVRRNSRTLIIESYYLTSTKQWAVSVSLQYIYSDEGAEESYGPVVTNPSIGNVYRGRFVGTFAGQSLSGTTDTFTFNGTEKEIRTNLPDHSSPKEGALSGTLYLEQYVTDTPSYINVPSQEVSKGSTIRISWGKSSDA